MKRLVVYSIGGIVAALVVAQASLLGWNTAHASQPVLGMHFQHQEISHLPADTLHNLLLAEIKKAESSTVTIHAGGYSEHVTPRQLGAKYDSTRIAERLLNDGRTGNFFIRLITQDKSLFGHENIAIGYPDIDPAITNAYLVRINAQIARPGENATFGIKDSKVFILADHPGINLNQSLALQALQNFDVISSAPEITLPTSNVSAAITTSSLQPVLSTVQNIVQTPLILKAQNKEVTLNSEQVLSLVGVTATTAAIPVPSSTPPPTPTPSPTPTAPLNVSHHSTPSPSATPTSTPKPTPSPTPVPPGPSSVVLTYNDSKINNVLDSLAQQVNSAPTPKVVSGSQTVSPGQEGAQIDGPHAKVEVMATLIKRSKNIAPPSPSPSPSAASSSPVPTTSPTPNPSNAQVVELPVEKLDPPVINTGSANANGPKVVTLTFDDGPNDTYTGKVLDILKHYNLHAIFFLVGRNVQNYPAVTKRILADGHTLGNHSFTHSDLATLPADKVKSELTQTQDVVKQTTNLSPVLFRPPYGSLNNTVRSAADNLHLQTMMWSVDPRDWSKPGASVITQRVVDAASPGANILLHVLYQQTVDALPGIIEGLQKKGYGFSS